MTHRSALTPTLDLLIEVLALTEPGGQLHEGQVMAQCRIGRTLARAALAALVERGDLKLLPNPGTVRYQRRSPIDSALVRRDLMPELLAAISSKTQTVGSLAQHFAADKAVIDATVRTMQQDGLISVATVGAAQVCRVASAVTTPAD